MRGLVFALILSFLLYSDGKAETTTISTSASPVPISSPRPINKKLHKATKRYIENINKKLVKGWEYKRPKVGLAFNLHILPDGSITEVKIVNSSGEQDVDDYALKYAKSLSPLPPLPKDFTGKSMDMVIIEEPW